MFKQYLYKHNVWFITIVLSICCVFASELIIVVLAAIFDQRHNYFTLAMGFVCPVIVAPVAIYSSLRLMKKLEESRHEVEELNKDLKEASNQINELSEMLPICSVCRKVRDDQGYWSQLDAYISRHSNTGFSHGYCPACYEKELKKIEKWKSGNSLNVAQR